MATNRRTRPLHAERSVLRVRPIAHRRAASRGSTGVMPLRENRIGIHTVFHVAVPDDLRASLRARPGRTGEERPDGTAPDRDVGSRWTTRSVENDDSTATVRLLCVSRHLRSTTDVCITSGVGFEQLDIQVLRLLGTLRAQAVRWVGGTRAEVNFEKSSPDSGDPLDRGGNTIASRRRASTASCSGVGRQALECVARAFGDPPR
jgi:hypothetical protein